MSKITENIRILWNRKRRDLLATIVSLLSVTFWYLLYFSGTFNLNPVLYLLVFVLFSAVPFYFGKKLIRFLEGLSKDG